MKIEEINDVLFDVQALMLNAYDRIESIENEFGIKGGESVSIESKEAIDIRIAYDKLTKLRKNILPNTTISSK